MSVRAKYWLECASHGGSPFSAGDAYPDRAGSAGAGDGFEDLDQFTVDRTKKAVGDAMLTNLTRSIAALSCVLLLGLAGCSDSGAEGSTNAAGDGTGSSSATPVGDQSNATGEQTEIQSAPASTRATFTDAVADQTRTVQPNLVAARPGTDRGVATTQPTKLPVSGDSTELIVIAEPISLDLGSIGTGQQAKGTIRLVNTGDKPMRVINCKANCGCTTTNCPKNRELQPGESVEVQVQMRAGAKGGIRQSKRVDFIVEGQPVLRVPVFVDVVAYVEIEPSKIDLQQTTDGRVVIRSLDDQPFRVLSMNPPWIEAFDDEARTEHVLYLPLDDLQAQSRARKIDFTIDHPQSNKVSMTLRRARTTPGNTSRIATARPPAATVDSPLAAAARSGDVAAIGQAIKDGKNLEQGYEDGATLLGIAAGAKQAEVVRVLLEAGAKIEARDQKGRMPLLAAVQTRNSSAEVVRALIAKGADVNTRGTMIGGTPLSWASGPFNNPEIVAALVAGNADVNQADNTGMTPLMWAARFGAPATVKVLLDAGADVTATNKQGQTSLDLARQKRSDAPSVQIIKMLEAQPPSSEKAADDSDS
ncbi:MAG: ankyrin repeat domain-containing protein [Planctomycetes bacterium]|nr:ankyrin repeat domain-containing protein [Planctomycetota bacterium]